jgi:hypothetical protein
MIDGKNWSMPVLLVFVFRFVRLLFSGHQAVAIENTALRMQIAAFQRKRKRPLLTTLDRVFWVTLRSVWSDWRHALLYVQADTVVRWQRAFSGKSGPDFPSRSVGVEVVPARPQNSAD